MTNEEMDAVVGLVNARARELGCVCEAEVSMVIPAGEDEAVHVNVHHDTFCPVSRIHESSDGSPYREVFALIEKEG